MHTVCADPHPKMEGNQPAGYTISPLKQIITEYTISALKQIIAVYTISTLKQIIAAYTISPLKQIIAEHGTIFWLVNLGEIFAFLC